MEWIHLVQDMGEVVSLCEYNTEPLGLRMW